MLLRHTPPHGIAHEIATIAGLVLVLHRIVGYAKNMIYVKGNWNVDSVNQLCEMDS